MKELFCFEDNKLDLVAKNESTSQAVHLHIITDK